jgi:NAD(P)-dependent dehydrogenase (short-subunit alcohol dehydrogenase family)
MINIKKGKIINLSGGGSTSPRPNFSAYAVAKTGIVRFTENLAEEVKEFNIDVNAIAPGAINTKMLEDVLHAENLAGIEYDEAVKRKKTGGNNPELAADLICFLASGLSDGITGKLISAPWDPWKENSYQNELRNNKDVAVLRRIDNKNFYKK